MAWIRDIPGKGTDYLLNDFSVKKGASNFSYELLAKVLLVTLPTAKVWFCTLLCAEYQRLLVQALLKVHCKSVFNAFT